MKYENIIAVGLLAIIFGTWALIATAEADEITSNDAIKGCLYLNDYTPENFETFDFSKAAGCFHNWKVTKEQEQLAELRDFLKHNPRYTVPGQSLNRCFGKPREMPFKSAYIEKNGDGFRAGITYKDKIPANCYENAPWDNRDLKGEGK
jgi:hypothetical protein